MATPRDIKVSHENVWVRGRLFWNAVLIALGAGFIAQQQYYGLSKIEEVVTEEINERKEEARAVIVELREINKQIAKLSFDYVPRSEIRTLLINLGRLNPEMVMPELTGR